MTKHRESSRRSLPLKILVIAAVSFVVGLMVERVFGSIGIDGVGWIAGVVAVLGLSELLLDARQRINAWKKGAVGEEKTENWLRKLDSRYAVIHDLAIAGCKANIDHVVIGPTGVFVIDSKRYRGKITENREGELWNGRYPLARAIESVRWQTTKLSDVAGGVEVNAILCIHGSELPRRNLFKNGVRIVGPRGMLRALEQEPVVFQREETESLAALIGKRMRRR